MPCHRGCFGGASLMLKAIGPVPDCYGWLVSDQRSCFYDATPAATEPLYHLGIDRLIEAGDGEYRSPFSRPSA